MFGARRSARMAAPLLRLADLLLTQCGAAALWPRTLPAGTDPDLADCRRLEVGALSVSLCSIPRRRLE